MKQIHHILSKFTTNDFPLGSVIYFESYQTDSSEMYAFGIGIVTQCYITDYDSSLRIELVTAMDTEMVILNETDSYPFDMAFPLGYDSETLRTNILSLPNSR